MIPIEGGERGGGGVKEIVPRVILMVEGAIIVPRRSHPKTIRSRQWHVIRRSHTIEKEFQRRG